MIALLIPLVLFGVIQRSSYVVSNSGIVRLAGSSRPKGDLVQGAESPMAKKHQPHQDNDQKLSGRSGGNFSNEKDTPHSMQPNTKYPVGVQNAMLSAQQPHRLVSDT